MARKRIEKPSGLWVRASVALPGLTRDAVAYVNPDDPLVRLHLDGLWLIPLSGQGWGDTLTADIGATVRDSGESPE